MNPNKLKEYFKLDESMLYQEIIEYMSLLYFPELLDENTKNKLFSDEFQRIRNLICRKNRLDKDKYRAENNGKSPFDTIRHNIEQEICNRICKDPQYLNLMTIRKQYIQMIRYAVEKENNIIGTFYRNRGKHYRDDEESPEYDTSPIIVIHNAEYYSYGGYEADTLYELFINSDKQLFCTLNGDVSEEFNEPIEHVQIEGLVDIAHWLAEQGFISFDTPYLR